MYRGLFKVYGNRGQCFHLFSIYAEVLIAYWVQKSHDTAVAKNQLTVTKSQASVRPYDEKCRDTRANPDTIYYPTQGKIDSSSSTCLEIRACHRGVHTSKLALLLVGMSFVWWNYIIQSGWVGCKDQNVVICICIYV